MDAAEARRQSRQLSRTKPHKVHDVLKHIREALENVAWRRSPTRALSLSHEVSRRSSIPWSLIKVVNVNAAKLRAPPMMMFLNLTLQPFTAAADASWLWRARCVTLPIICWLLSKKKQPIWCCWKLSLSAATLSIFLSKTKVKLMIIDSLSVG